MTADPHRQPGLSRREVWAYAFPSFVFATLMLPMFVYLPKLYTDVVGVSITFVGAMFLLGRLIDAVTDPLFGHWSDRTRHRLGRRRPFLLWGTGPLALLILWLYIPPRLSPGLATLWFAIGALLFPVALTAVYVPYRAIGPELTFDSTERTRLFSVRESLFVSGMVADILGPPLSAWAFGLDEGPAGQRARFAIFASGATVLMAASNLWCFRVIRERGSPSSHSTAGMFSGLRDAMQNRPFRILLAAYAIAALGNNLPAGLISYYGTYYHGAENVSWFLVLFVGAGLVAVPFWVAFANRHGRKTAWLVALGVTTAPFLGVFFLRPGQLALFGLLCAASGLGIVATFALVPAMQADVIDYDELRRGERREGQFIGLWAVAEKAAAAVGMGIALIILGIAGYVPNRSQEPQVLLTLRVLYVLVPCLCNAAAIALVLRYPINARRHRDVLSAIERRRAGLDWQDPLGPDSPRQSTVHEGGPGDPPAQDATA
jgi:GPH family glycoside/pentoside/hexuronide:cation symporter